MSFLIGLFYTQCPRGENMHALTPLGDCLDSLTALVIVFLENKVKFVFCGPNLTKTNSETTKMAEKINFLSKIRKIWPKMVKNCQKIAVFWAFFGRIFDFFGFFCEKFQKSHLFSDEPDRF